MFKRFLAITICILMVIQSLPMAAFADLNLEDYGTEQELRQAIEGDEEWKERFPNGLFNFIGTKFQVDEDQEFFEIAVVRQGGTQGSASVGFKAIDISAEYGEDYVIRVYENSSKNEMEKNPDSIPMIQTIGDNSSITISESVYGETVSEGIVDSDTDEIVPVEEDGYTDLPKAKVTVGEGEENGVNSLRQARAKYLDKQSDRPDWRSIDENRVEELKVEYDKFLYNVEGAETTLEFADGEYIKYLYLVPLNDEMSESEEQVLFALEKPEDGASRGEFYMAYLNIIDDEKPEKVEFEIETPTVMAENGTASIIVKRIGGLGQYSSVSIGTEEGTAVSGIDYAPGLEELFFTPGTKKQTISVNILDNPVRTKNRSFTIALDRTDENVKRAEAEAVVTIPAVTQKSSAPYLGEATPINTNAEKISDSGSSPSKGKWTIKGTDLTAHAMTSGESNLNIETSYPGDGFKLEYTYGTGSWGDQYEMYSPVSSLWGVDTLGFNYYNDGKGSGAGYDYNFKFLLFNKPYMCTPADYDERYYKSFEGRYDTPLSYETPVLDANTWKDTKAFYITSYAGDNNHTAPYISGITLKLKAFSTNILPAGEKIQLKNYSIAKGIPSDTVVDEFDPGTLYVKNVYSNVGNYQSSPTNPTVYRSDRIELGYKYSVKNANGKYSTFTGIEVKSGNDWVFFEGTELVLDANFYKWTGIPKALELGKIEMRPVFKRNEAGFTINLDPEDGEVVNFVGNTSYGNSYQYYFVNKPSYVGDTISGLEARPYDVTKPAAWTAQSGFYRNMKDNTIGLVMTNTNGKVTVSYTLEETYNTIYLSFGEQLIVKAQPYIYRNRVYMQPYKLDGTKYSDRKAFIDKMEEIYGAAEENPTLEMNFDYTYESQSYATEHPEPEAFGDPEKAYLKVYRNDGTLRKSYTIEFYYLSEKYNYRSFKFTCKPKDEGWELDDYATVSIVGSKMDGSKYSQTEEAVVDFIANSADGVIVTIPKDKDTADSWGGNINKPIKIDPANINGNYIMQAITSPGYTTQWMDSSPDYNNDGNMSSAEMLSMEKNLQAIYGNDGITLNSVWDDKVYLGNNFAYRPSLFNPSKIYYNFIRLSENVTNWNVKAVISERFSTVLNPTEVSNKLPVRNGEVYIGQKRIDDKDVDGDGTTDGVYEDKDYTYIYGFNYLGQLFYKGSIFNFAVTPAKDTEQVIYPSNLMRVYDFKAKIREDSKETDQELDKTNTLMSIMDAVTTFTYRIDGSKAGIVPNDSVINIYDKNGENVLKVRTGAPVGEEFTYSMNTLAEGIKTGYRMTIAGMLVQGDTIVKEFPEAEVGLTFSMPLTAITTLASFKAPLEPIVQLMGKLDNKYDLGLKVDYKNKLKLSEYRDSNGKKRKIKTVSFGFNDEYTKTFEDNAKDTEEDTEKGNDDVIEEKTKDKNSDELNDAVEDARPDENSGNQPKTKNSGGGDFHMPYEISLALTLELGQIYDERTGLYSDDGYHYFSSLVIMATATATYKYEKTYMTPIGIPVTATISAGGGASAAIAFEADHKDPYNLKYQLSADNNGGNIELNPKNYDIYSKFMITPTVTLGAAAGYDYLNLEISGTADFDFSFGVPITGTAIHSSGSGGMVISSQLKLKILFVQKKWKLYKSKHIDFFSYGKESSEKLVSALSDPYRSYMYEKVTAPGEEDILARDYIDNRGDWDSGSSTSFGLSEVNTGAERILQAGVFPYPQTKLVKIDEDRTLLLFIEDDTDRGERNRASLMYSILEGESSTQPVALDDDGTWDEAPDAFVIEDRILVTWSDAGREFEDTDNEKDILGAMNISGIWFDMDTEEFGDEYAITKTVEDGDGYSDINPKISYDPDTKRIMVYYTKTDHSDNWEFPPTAVDEETVPTVPLYETPSLLYGDIVNGYDVIAYRYADYNSILKEFAWNETYTPEESLDSYEYYGQRFPTLAPVAKIVENEIKIDDETITVGGKEVTLAHTGTNQTIMPYSGLEDPRIIDMDLITYDGKAIFTYIIDYDSNPATQSDYQLYIQTYDYSAKTFSYPIQITNDELLDEKPRFVCVKDIMYLYWLHDGDIVYTNISELLNDSGKLKKMTVPESVYAADTFYIIDKENTTKDAYINMAVNDEDPIEDYDIASNGSSVYALWAEERTSYKDNLQAGDRGTDDPANINKERQIFAACAVPVESANGIEILPWSAPVQLTFDPGVSYSDLSFAIAADDEFLVSYAKYEQQYDADEGYHTSTDSIRELAVNLFTISSEVELGELSIDTEYPLPEKIVNVSAAMSNTGLKPLEDIYYQLYVSKGGSEYYSTDWYPEENATHYILGGTSKEIKGSFTMPEAPDALEELTVGFRVKNGAGDLLVEKEKKVPIKPELQIQVKESSLISKDTAFVNLYVKNIGNMDFKNDFSIAAGDKILHTEQLQLQTGEFKQLSMEVELGGASFGELYTTEDGGRFDLLTLNFDFGEFEATGDIKREISTEAYNELQKVDSLRISTGGKIVANGADIILDLGSMLTLEEKIVKKAGMESEEGDNIKLEVVWSSDKPEVMAVLDNGSLASLGYGVATVTAAVQPVTMRTLSYEDGSFEVQEDTYSVPEAVKKKISFTVKVRKDSDHSGSGGSSPVILQNPVSGSVSISERVEGEKLTLIFDEKSLSEALKGVNGVLMFRTSNENSNIKQLELVLTASNLKAISESNANRVTISGPLGNVSLDRKAIDAIKAAVSASGKDAVIGFSIRDGIIEITITVDGKRLQNLNGGAILFSTGHKPEAAQDHNGILVYDISGEGAPKPITASMYNTETGEVMFKTDTIGQFKIGYNKPEFPDDLGWADEYITFLASRNIVIGGEDGRFLKDKPVTRAEFITMLSRITGDMKLTGNAVKFEDVNSDDWFALQVKWAHENGIISGTSDTKFSPDSPINREQMATILFRYMKYMGIQLPQGVANDFADKGQLSGWSVEAVNAMRAAGFMVGTGDNSFEPGRISNRAEAAKVIAEILKALLR